jgi:predicted enzyme related to lactoylglutathione lyase
MPTHLRFGFAVVNVRDIAKAKSFYTEVFGLKVQREAPQFIQFEHFAIASDSPSASSPTELYWLVDDVEAAHRALAACGATCSPVDAKPFGKLFSVQDPEGHERSVLELAASRPSEPV